MGECLGVRPRSYDHATPAAEPPAEAPPAEESDDLEEEPKTPPPAEERPDLSKTVARPDWEREADDPALLQLSRGALVEKGQLALDRASGGAAADEEVERDLREARRYFLAAYHRDRDNLYLIDVLLDIEALLAIRGGKE